MSKIKKEAVFGDAREATIALATYFDQFATLNVAADIAVDTNDVDVITLYSTATSHGARVCIDYKHKFVDVHFVNRYTLVSKGRRQHVKSTVELEQLLRKNKVLINLKLISFDAATDEQLLTVAKGEGFDDWGGAVGRAYWAGVDNGFLNRNDRTAIVVQLRKMGFQSVDITDRNLVDASEQPAPKPGDVVVTEAEWLNGVQKPRQRRYL